MTIVTSVSYDNDLCGDAEYALITITDNDLAAINDAIALLGKFRKKHGSWQKLEHFDVDITLLTEFPPGFGLAHGLCENPETALKNGPISLDDPPDEFYLAAGMQGKIVRSELGRLSISTIAGIEAACYEKHGDVRITTEDIEPLLGLTPTPVTQ